MTTHRSLIALLLLMAGLCAPRVAGAETLSFTGQVEPSDPTMNVLPYSSPASTCGTIAPFALATQPNYDAYALRNTGGADCVTVEHFVPLCGQALASSTFSGAFAPKQAAASLIGGGHFAVCPGSLSHQASVPAGSTFVPTVFPVGAAVSTTAYTLSVTGASLEPANAVDVTGGGLPNGNELTLNASSLEDGSAVEGTAAVSSTGGQSYSGPVSCLRVDGDRASVLMSITGGNAPAKFTGAVFWLEESATTSGGQRNSLLTAAQLARYGGACPDPNAPIGGTFRSMTAGYASVIDTPPVLPECRCSRPR